MSAICVSPEVFASKAALQQALNSEKGVELVQYSPYGSTHYHSNGITVGFSGVVTNHPKRTKFAKIEKRADGWKVS